MTENFFPFRIYSASEASFNLGFHEIFQGNRPEYIEHVEAKGTPYEWIRKDRFSWHSYDVIVHSQTEIEFVCFDMADFVYGGRGKEIHRFRVGVDKKVTNGSIGRRLFSRGADKRALEIAEEERKRCQKFADEERKALGITF